MSKCDNCRLRKESEKAFDIHWLGEDDCPYDKCPVPDFPKTYADRIRAMTDEELAGWISGRKETCPPIKGYKCSIKTCRDCWLDWLKQEEVNTDV